MPPSDADRWIAEDIRRQQEEEAQAPVANDERKAYLRRIAQLREQVQQLRRQVPVVAKGGARHLVIPDAHADTLEEPNDRFDWIARMARDRRPDVIVCLGDVADMASLCQYEVKGSVPASGRSFREDIASGRDAIARMTPKPTKTWQPKLWLCWGNHENRIDTFRFSDSRLQDICHLKDFGAEDAGWQTVPFEQPIVIDRIAYCHFFTKVAGKNPIRGDYPAQGMLREGHMSCVAGHSHVKDLRENRCWDGGKIFGIHAGCWMERPMHYLPRVSSAGWWRGLFEIERVDGKGFGHPVAWPLEDVKARYGG